ncbi:MAG: 2-amino-4-hydroxy-6-hydroxymethyldihydropteridine diphosphokinase [Salinivirgaceae bacterium]|jgi:2-amino-4-hydroxy-6-hydroxymethyldihydropteridine diphosphokinase|nr:2-amino-4-hydroxy-6-hydroxymethyldihydropteridine diphosphokinase [Salinivirgaceae bacterium]
MTVNTVYIELGGNEGNRFERIHNAKKTIANSGCEIILESSLYETPPWGFKADKNFYNQIIKVVTTLSAFELIRKLHIIESEFGRKRIADKYCSRTMDLDILFFNNDIVKTAELVIPHERLHLRNFVLIPMHEIASDLIHPVLKKTISELLHVCTDNSVCSKVDI